MAPIRIRISSTGRVREGDAKLGKVWLGEEFCKVAITSNATIHFSLRDNYPQFEFVVIYVSNINITRNNDKIHLKAFNS